MNIVCLDMEGVLVPEIWIAFAEASGIPELRRTTRDEPDYDKLMRYRIAILKEHGLKLQQIQETIAKIDPMPGAKEFLDALRSETQVMILSDTFEQFAMPLMKKLSYPTLLCNTLEVAPRRRDPPATRCAARSRSSRPSARCSPSAMRRSPPATASTIWA